MTRASKTAAKKTTPAKNTTAARAPRTRKTAAAKKTTAAKKTAPPRLSLVESRSALPVREPNFMTDAQGHATIAARIAGITTPHIRHWVDHHDGTVTRRLLDGTLHYTTATRTLAWQATCRMGAVHTYPIPTPSAAAQARVLAAQCTQPHADLSAIPALTADELEALGLLQTPTWARKDLLGEAPTITIPVAEEPVAQAIASAADTQPMSKQAIAEGLAARAADTETPKEHPQP